MIKKYSEHKLYGRIRALNIPLYELRRALGENAPCESTLSRGLRLISPLSEEVVRKIESFLDNVEKESKT